MIAVAGELRLGWVLRHAAAVRFHTYFRIRRAEDLCEVVTIAISTSTTWVPRGSAMPYRCAGCSFTYG